MMHGEHACVLECEDSAVSASAGAAVRAMHGCMHASWHASMSPERWPPLLGEVARTDREILNFDIYASRIIPRK